MTNSSPNTLIYQRRTKTETACNECRRSKLKCDQTIPRATCKRCKEKEILCEYVGGAGSPPEVSSFPNSTPISSNQYNVTPNPAAARQPIPMRPWVSNSTNSTPTSSNQYNMTPNATAARHPVLMHPRTHPIPTGMVYMPETSDVVELPSGYQAEQMPAQTSQERRINTGGQLCYCSQDHLCIHHTNLDNMGEYMDVIAYENSQNSMPEPMAPAHRG